MSSPSPLNVAVAQAVDEFMRRLVEIGGPTVYKAEEATHVVVHYAHNGELHKVTFLTSRAIEMEAQIRGHFRRES